MNNNSVHDQAVSIVEKHIQRSIGGALEAEARCNECGDFHRVNFVENACKVLRNKSVGPVRPDLSIIDASGQPIRFIEIVDSHKPEPNVHDFALDNNIEVFEFHLRAKEVFSELAGPRKNKAVDSSLVVKARLKDLQAKQLMVDAHTLSCQRPRCEECSSPLPRRTIAIDLKNCWKCNKNIKIAVGYKNNENMEQDLFTDEEVEFTKQNGVILKHRFSGTIKAKYLANVCPYCDQIQGNWFLYQDPFHDRFRLNQTKRESYGPCDKCSTYWCYTHGEYFGYTGNIQCPECVQESEKIMCPHVSDRQCYYPDRCQQAGCYFQNREEQRKQEIEKRQSEREDAAAQYRKTYAKKLRLDRLRQAGMSDE